MEAGIAIAGLLAISIVAYSLYLMSNTVKQLIPLIQISNDMKVRVSSAHLWFEEAVEGDTTINLQAQVMDNIDGAIRLVQEQQSRIHRMEPRLYRQMQKGIETLLKELNVWKQQTEIRWRNRADSAPGTPSDQIYDATFQKILQLCDENKRNIDALVNARQKMINGINVPFILFLVCVFTALIIISTRYRGFIQAKNLALVKLSQAVEQTDDLVTITNKDGIIEYVNPAFERLTGFLSSEAAGQKPSILKSGKHDDAFYLSLWETITAGKVFRAEIMNRKKNGELFYEEKTISPIRDAEGNITHYVSTAKDITERRSMEKELMHSRAMKMLGQIASGVAHEVRNPLNAILAISETMFQDFKAQAEYSEYLDHIRKQVNRLSSLMRDLLEIGKSIPPSTMRSTPLNILCASSIELWKQYQTHSSQTVRLVQPASGNHINIRVNRGKLQQVFVNLLENASQHSPPDSEIRIVIQEPKKKQVQVCVQDLGPGISGESLDQIFEPFFTTRKSGTGLGLSIVKHIIETHGGNITIHNNNPAPGCCVEINLPLATETRDETTDTSY